MMAVVTAMEVTVVAAMEVEAVAAMVEPQTCVYRKCDSNPNV